MLSRRSRVHCEWLKGMCIPTLLCREGGGRGRGKTHDLEQWILNHTFHFAHINQLIDDLNKTCVPTSFVQDYSCGKLHIQIPNGYVGLTLHATTLATASWSTCEGTMRVLWATVPDATAHTVATEYPYGSLNGTQDLQVTTAVLHCMRLMYVVKGNLDVYAVRYICLRNLILFFWYPQLLIVNSYQKTSSIS